MVNSDAGCCPRRRRCERRHADTRAGRISSRRIAFSPPWYPRKPHTPTGYLPTELVLHIYRLYRPNQPWPDTEPSGCTSTTRVPRLSAHHRQTHQKKKVGRCRIKKKESRKYSTHKGRQRQQQQEQHQLKPLYGGVGTTIIGQAS